MRRLLFLFLPALAFTLELPHAPGMYPPEETNSNVGTAAPSAYMMSEPEEPYMFYYEKDPAPPGPTKSGQAPSGSPEEPKPPTGSSSQKAYPEDEDEDHDGTAGIGPRGPSTDSTSSSKAGGSSKKGKGGSSKPGGHGPSAGLPDQVDPSQLTNDDIYDPADPSSSPGGKGATGSGPTKPSPGSGSIGLPGSVYMGLGKPGSHGSGPKGGSAIGGAHGPSSGPTPLEHPSVSEPFAYEKEGSKGGHGRSSQGNGRWDQIDADNGRRRITETDEEGGDSNSFPGKPRHPPAPEAPQLVGTNFGGSPDGSEGYEKGSLGRKSHASQGHRQDPHQKQHREDHLGPNSSWGSEPEPQLRKINVHVPSTSSNGDFLGPDDPTTHPARKTHPQLVKLPSFETSKTSSWNPEQSELDRELSKLDKLPVEKEQVKEFNYGRTQNKAPWEAGQGGKVCCPCCRDKKPVIGGGYLESSAPATVVPYKPEVVYPILKSQPPSQAIPIGQQSYPLPPAPQQQPVLLNPNPAPVSTGYTGYGGSYNTLPGTFYPTAPVSGQYTPAVAAPSYGGGGGCGCAPQICCQPVSPCCLPSLPCCPPPPPIPCCPQISLCCQPIIPCCLPPLPQICLPTIPLCFRSCPACPCRRRRSVEDPRYKRAAVCQRRRVKRNGNCRQCSNWNAITQVAGNSGCGTCNGSHKRVKRLGCLPCGRKKREVEQANEHARQKRSCLPCLGGRKKRDASCRSCSLLQTYITRQKRTINCGPCGGRKKREAPCPCASSAGASPATASVAQPSPLPEPPRMKRSVSENYDAPFTCDRSCCDYDRCDELRAKKLDLKL